MISRFSLQVQTPQFFRFLSVGTFKTPSVFSLNWKWRNTFPTRILCLSDHLQLPRDLWKGAHAYIGSGGEHSEHFFVNCDLINHKNSTPIKLGTCIVNVLCQLWVKYCIIQEFTVERNLSIKLKRPLTSGLYVCETFSLLWCKEHTLEVLSKHLVYILCTVTVSRLSSRVENSRMWSDPCI